jgi:hypothetical protein
MKKECVCSAELDQRDWRQLGDFEMHVLPFYAIVI